MCYISSFLLIPNGSKVLPLSMRYASLAFRTLSLLDLMSSSKISVMSLAEWSLIRKCSETVLGFLDIRWIVKWSAVFVETVFNDVLLMAVVALYHVNDVLRVTVDVMSDRSIWFHL